MTARRLCYAIAFLVLVFHVVVVADEADPKATTPLLSVKGQVVDSTGKPVESARVILREWSSLRLSRDPFLEAVQDILAETTTNADGRFQFGNVPSRPFRFLEDPAPWDVVAIAHGHGMAWSHLTSAESDVPLTLQLPPAKAITGRLVDQHDKPVVGCEVELAGITAPGSPWYMDLSHPSRLDLWRSQIAPKATSDANGRFDLADLPADQRLSFIALHPRYERAHMYVATTEGPQPAVVQPASVAGQRTEEAIAVRMSGFTEKLKPGRSVSGRVILSDTDKSVAQAKVSLIWQSRSFHKIADDDGRFNFTSLPDPTYLVTSRTDEPGYLASRILVQISNGAVDQVVTLKLPRGELVRGEVLDADSGDGVPTVGVAYVPPDAGENDGWSPAEPVKTDTAGKFEIVVPSGQGELRVGGGLERHPTHDVPDFRQWLSKQRISPEHSVKIDVKSGKPLEGVQLKVAKGLVIAGRVVDSDGKPVFGAEVRAADRFRRPDAERVTATDDEGRFEFTSFPRDEERQIDVIDSVSKLRGSATLTVDALAKASRELKLGDITLRGTGTVSGQVLGDGKPLAGARVGLIAQVERDGKEEYLSSNEQTETGKDGRFTFDSVQAGVRVSVYVNQDGYTSQGTQSNLVEAGKEVEFPAIELKSRGAFVAGVVVDLEGKPVEGVTVSAWQRDGYSSIAYGRDGAPPPTDAEGRFRINDLPNVPLKLMAYITPPEPRKDRSIRFPATVNAEPNQSDVRIVLDPKLQRPLP